MSTTQHIKTVIKAFNKSWITGELERLGDFLHPDVVFVNTVGIGRVKGQENCIDALSNFITHAKNKWYDISNEKIEIWGKTAVASFEFEMSYQLAGRDFQKKGRDLLVFNLDQDQDTWRVVYSTVSPY